MVWDVAHRLLFPLPVPVHAQPGGRRQQQRSGGPFETRTSPKSRGQLALGLSDVLKREGKGEQQIKGMRGKTPSSLNNRQISALLACRRVPRSRTNEAPGSRPNRSRSLEHRDQPRADGGTHMLAGPNTQTQNGEKAWADEDDPGCSVAPTHFSRSAPPVTTHQNST